jgi:VanZ family protein
MKTKLLLTQIFLTVIAFFAPLPVSAQNTSLLPPSIQEFFTNLQDQNLAVFFSSRVRTALTIALALLILVAVVYAILASFKYIQSQGDPGKIEEAQKAIKAIFYGIGALFVGLIGIVLVNLFIGADDILDNTSIYESCLRAPSSTACNVCNSDGNDGSNLCYRCEMYYTDGTVGSEVECK